MEYSPKNVMMSCFYLGAKIDEFNVSIDEFVINLKSDITKSNSETISSFEPQIILKLWYQLTIHLPNISSIRRTLNRNEKTFIVKFRFGEMRSHAKDFFKKVLFGDVILLYPPSQIALTVLKYALHMLDKTNDLLKDQLLNKMLGINGSRKATMF